MRLAREPWGKLDRSCVDPSRAQRLTLVAHCIDVAAVVGALLAEPTMRARLETLAGRALNAVDVQRLVALAFLHDVGKCSAGFFSKCLPVAEQEAWMAKAGISRSGLGHTRVVRALFESDAQLRAMGDAVWVDDIIGWHDESLADDGPVLWFAAISHHGLPVNVAYLRGNDRATPGRAWTTPAAGYVPLQGLQRLGAAARALFPLAWVVDSPSRPLQLPANAAFTHAFAGLVSLADWIGSNVKTDFFPYDLAEQDESRWPVAAARAADVLRRMRIDQRDARVDLAGRAPTFEQVFPFPPSAAQTACGATDLGNIVVLESETGSGKTEAALWRFKSLFETGLVDSLAFLLPTRVSATAIHTRVSSFMARLFPDASLRPPVVLAVPGYMRVDDVEAERVLPGFEVLWPDDVPDGDLPRFWAAENSKRYFSAAAAVGTIDQLLLSALEVKHSHMRASALLRALVVVDEVHASDAYMSQLLEVALERHASAGAHALLLSATLGGEVRGQLVQAGTKPPVSASAAALLSDRAAPYPCLTDIRGTRQLVAAGHVERQKRVQVRVVPALLEAEVVAALVAVAARQGAKVLVIRNTVRLALETQRALECELGSDHSSLFRCAGVVAMHHGRYSAADRRMLDARVEVAFGKASASTRTPVVLVGTQTLEISLDCDADLLVTDLCPMDVMLQRIGRLHRHPGRDPHRPAEYAVPQIAVLRPTDRDLGAMLGPRSRESRRRGVGIGPRSAYENLIAIEATLRQLESRAVLTIPSDNRELVEACTDSGTLRGLAESMRGPWVEHADALFGKRAAQAGQAWRRSMPWTRAWSELSSADSLDEPARTRLGLDGRKFALGARWISPFGAPMSEVTVPGWMLPEGTLPEGVEDLAMSTSIAASERSLRFTVGGRRFVYDRLGLAPEGKA
ncbi:MAG: CRISPR-associated helicase Cas3' [Pseudomonadota bacterium]